jgi:hypothetical protein
VGGGNGRKVTDSLRADSAACSGCTARTDSGEMVVPDVAVVVLTVGGGRCGSEGARGVVDVLE